MPLMPPSGMSLFHNTSSSSSTSSSNSSNGSTGGAPPQMNGPSHHLMMQHGPPSGPPPPPPPHGLMDHNGISMRHGGMSDANHNNMEPVKEPGLCAGCGGKIVDRYFLMAVDKQWHVSCLTCTDCRVQLDSELTCFAKDGRIYCKEDYYR